MSKIAYSINIVNDWFLYRLPLARLWVLQSIWQFFWSVGFFLLQAATWSASISACDQIFLALASCPRVQCGQLETPFSLAVFRLVLNYFIKQLNWINFKLQHLSSITTTISTFSLHTNFSNF